MSTFKMVTINCGHLHNRDEMDTFTARMKWTPS